MLVLALFSLVAAACGGDETVEAGDLPNAELPEDSQTDPDLDDDPEVIDDADGSESEGADADGTEGGNPVTGGYQLTDAQPDMISGQPAPIDEVVIVDDQTIGVRYENGSEPCSLADVTVTETDAEIVVALQTGLHPNAAAMSCIAQVLSYEIQVSLDAPVGDRTIVTTEA